MSYNRRITSFDGFCGPDAVKRRTAAPVLQEQRSRRKDYISQHAPARDVTAGIYTATGKRSFLHCYVVTDGAGKGVFSLQRLRRFDVNRRRGNNRIERKRKERKRASPR